MKTYSVRASEIDRRWWVVDVSGKTLGRVATEIAALLRGKGKPIYSPHLDVGDFVVVVNAANVSVTGKKANDKVYYRHTQYPGGLKSITWPKCWLHTPPGSYNMRSRGCSLTIDRVVPC